MKFLIDAQLPIQLVELLQMSGYEMKLEKKPMNIQLVNSLVQIIESLTPEERTLLFDRLTHAMFADDF